MFDPTVPIIQIWPREEFRYVLGMEIKRSIRYACFFSLLSIALDYSRNSHCLSRLEEYVRQTIRCTDTMGYMDSDQIGVILHHAESRDIYGAAERIRERVAHSGFERMPAGSQTVSIGAVCFPTHISDFRSLILVSGQMLGRAKLAGGNQICCPGLL
jgi:diguanylate cyclase (GGDEF)-like protein